MSSSAIDWTPGDDLQWWDPDLVADGQTQPYWEQAAGRVDFQLSYHRSQEPRVFSYAELEGAAIDDSNDSEHKRKSVGDWSIGDRPMYTREDSVQAWINIYTEAALQEGVHEVLEYLKVDGEHWMNPHREYEEEIMLEVTRFVDRLRTIREGGDPDGESR